MLRRVLAGLLVGSAVLFAIGVAIENGDSHHVEGADAPAGRSTVVAASLAHTAVPLHEGDGDEGGNSEGGQTGEKATTADRGEGEADILGVSPESTGAVAAAVVISVLLAIGVLRWPRRALFVVVAIVCLAFAAADIAEAMHKFDESQSGIGAIASIVALGHITAALISGYLATQPTATTSIA